jgi:uncharacterized protein YvpB
VSSTQYEYDFEYDTGRSIPRDSAGWQEFRDARKKIIIKWVDNALLTNNDDNTFFNISYAKQQKLRLQHPSLEEAWKTYITLLQVTNE